MIPTLTAGTGETLPTVGFGTYNLNGDSGVDSVVKALGNGYRLLDSAFNYENEGAVGKAVRTSGVDREEIIVTSKLPGRHHAHDEAIATIEESVFRTGLDYLDLYLIHWPNPKTGKYVEAWQALIEAKERGLLKAIGVSNFLPEHLDRLQAETGVVPAVNQIEIHPYFPQTEAIADLHERGILVEAWSPLGRGNDLLSNPVITEIAAEQNAEPGQVVLAWHIARGTIPLAKAGSTKNQLANLAAVDLKLTEDQLARITGLGRPDGRIDDQDPAEYEEY
ncbi:aldo/keto reductase [Naumannella halotolerans]|uniref:aldo/keto reductase n=1 Tax=Naumannella halotolerans TaxID=993414 RepID=UPI00370DBBBC